MIRKTGRAMAREKLWSQRAPIFFWTAVRLKRVRRMFDWHCDGRTYARDRLQDNLPFRIREHRSVLLRRLEGVDPQWQINKVTNLKLAISCLDGVVIRPGEVFSFYRLVGSPHAGRGFLPGLELSGGRARAGIGGGLCQLANLLHWMVLHSPLTVSEHHHHSYDIFPDDDRVQPFGSGATLYYNYLDYQLSNQTPHTFQFRLAVTDTHLEGALLCDTELPEAYEIFERNHAYVRQDGAFYRTNELWRRRHVAATGAEIETSLLRKNFARVMYEPKTLAEKTLAKMP